MNKFHLTGLFLAAFALGALLEHFALPAAEARQAKPAIADTLVAHRIALVDAQGQTAGIFVAERTSADASAIALYDGKGQLLWRAGNGLQPITVGH